MTVSQFPAPSIILRFLKAECVRCREEREEAWPDRLMDHPHTSPDLQLNQHWRKSTGVPLCLQLSSPKDTFVWISDRSGKTGEVYFYQLEGPKLFEPLHPSPIDDCTYTHCIISPSLKPHLVRISFITLGILVVLGQCYYSFPCKTQISCIL